MITFQYTPVAHGIPVCISWWREFLFSRMIQPQFRAGIGFEEWAKPWE